MVKVRILLGLTSVQRIERRQLSLYLAAGGDGGDDLWQDGAHVHLVIRSRFASPIYNQLSRDLEDVEIYVRRH